MQKDSPNALPGADELPFTVVDVMKELEETPNFLQKYGNISIQQLVADWQEIELGRDDEAWARLPPQEFIDFCRSYPPTPFDGIPPSREYLKPPTFLISQAHRIWLTTSLVNQRLAHLKATSLLDLGSFPFFASFVLRDYFGYKGHIAVTTNLELSNEARNFLLGKSIEVLYLDLDPFVHDPLDTTTKLSSRIESAHLPFDLILSSHVIEHLYHPKKMVEECFRVLRKGGELVVTTDNAMMIDTFANYLGGYGYIFEPIEGTAAMHFSFWRGHVRFFTCKDLCILLGGAGFHPNAVRYFHCFYDVLFPEFFRKPKPALAGWKRKLISETPWLGNDVALVASK
jgi:SAM-dependent methyltransferase